MKRTHSSAFPPPTPAATTDINSSADPTGIVPTADSHPSQAVLRNRPPSQVPVGFDSTASSAGSARSAIIATPSTLNGIPVGTTATTAKTLMGSSLLPPGLAACPAAQPLLRLWNICTSSNTPIPDLSGVPELERLDQLTRAVKDNNLGKIAALILAGAPLRPPAISGFCTTQSGNSYIPPKPILPLAVAIKKARIDALDVLLLHPAAAAEKTDERYLIAAIDLAEVLSDDWEKLIPKMLTEGFAVEKRGQFPVIDSALGSYMYRTYGKTESVEVFELFLSAGANPNIWIIDTNFGDELSLPDYLQRRYEIVEEDPGYEGELSLISKCATLLKDAGCILHDKDAMKQACDTNNIVLLEKQLRFDLRDETAREKFPQTVDTMDPDVFPEPVVRDLLNHPDVVNGSTDFQTGNYPLYFTSERIFSDANSSSQEYKNRLIGVLKEESNMLTGLISSLEDLLGTENGLLEAIALTGFAPSEAQAYQCAIHLLEGLANDPKLNAKANASYLKFGLSMLTQKNLATLLQLQAMKAASCLRFQMSCSGYYSPLISDMKNFLACSLFCSLPPAGVNLNPDATQTMREFLVAGGFFEPLVPRILAAWTSVNQAAADVIPLFNQSDEISDEAFLNTEAGEKLANQFGQALLEQFKLDKPSVLVPPAGSGADKDAFAVIMQPQYELVTGYARGAAEFKRAS